ncbi:hypothetical protein H1W83_28245 (plasmid) [Priestia megaterium]|uniref:hypothetical protein n=1 Tax=Priestia megaterium TaxID=1404 RepID=UPI001EDA119D|nr:hypothetical protein [Priestia megaterium]UKJ83561.1 hypothetical protein H1W83_28245 [Priestia megaterium]
MFSNLFLTELSRRLGSLVTIGTEDSETLTGVLARVSADVIVVVPTGYGTDNNPVYISVEFINFVTFELAA